MTPPHGRDMKQWSPFKEVWHLVKSFVEANFYAELNSLIAQLPGTKKQRDLLFRYQDHDMYHMIVPVL